MAVRVKLSTLLRESANWQEVVEVHGHTVMDCLNDLEVRFPDIRKWIYDKNGTMWDRLQVFVNGAIIRRDELSNPLQDNDELFVLLNIGGG